mmetsp:Transcript_15344/g.59991  ORF Transcript_15344/g.59991 Transcript_15344/m.59991 type:complete len:214 (-) Transcript_15344:931-1572(-)
MSRRFCARRMNFLYSWDCRFGWSAVTIVVATQRLSMLNSLETCVRLGARFPLSAFCHLQPRNSRRTTWRKAGRSRSVSCWAMTALGNWTRSGAWSASFSGASFHMSAGAPALMLDMRRLERDRSFFSLAVTTLLFPFLLLARPPASSPSPAGAGRVPALVAGGVPWRTMSLMWLAARAMHAEKACCTKPRSSERNAGPTSTLPQRRSHCTVKT